MSNNEHSPAEPTPEISVVASAEDIIRRRARSVSGIINIAATIFKQGRIITMSTPEDRSRDLAEMEFYRQSLSGDIEDTVAS